MVDNELKDFVKTQEETENYLTNRYKQGRELAKKILSEYPNKTLEDKLVLQYACNKISSAITQYKLAMQRIEEQKKELEESKKVLSGLKI